MNKRTKTEKNNSTMDTKFDKYCNKIWMYETIIEFDNEKMIEIKITSLTTDNTNYVQSDIVESANSTFHWYLKQE